MNIFPWEASTVTATLAMVVLTVALGAALVYVTTAPGLLSLAVLAVVVAAFAVAVGAPAELRVLVGEVRAWRDEWTA